MMNTMSAFLNPAADPVDSETDARDGLRRAGWWQRCPFAEAWPITLDQAAELLYCAGEYSVDSDDLRDLIERRIPARPARDEADFEFNASDILEMVGALETRQQWRPTPSMHDPKKHACQLLLEQARADDAVVAITRGAGNGQGPRFDVRHLLAMLSGCDSREGRCKIIPLLKAVLEVEHGLIL